MESNIKGLVAAGHEMASELKAECGAVDMRSVAKLLSDLATQLEVQLVRANALAEDQQRAIESIKQADSAVKLAHEKFSALAAENAGLKAICDDRRRFIMNGVQMGYIKVPAAETDPDLETIRIAISPQKPIPATDAFLSEVRAQGVDAAIEAAKNLVVQEYDYKDFKAAQSDCCMHPGSDLVGKVEMTEWLVDFAAQLRKGGNQ
ncbi:eae-like domain protein [Escherichia coli]|uniref:eae-like domain protein n=1 Tax=Escherichia albertii TaxID=208962 RepID=UPI000F66DE86|nr:eae-like domain protein [Escherichia albertii]EFJ8977103.1 eae-like domain protein [Escherichia coli]EHL9251575.1 eae-like domain protein [Escherichia coli]EKK7672283.1 eae-like domain protein [Escherichia coli]ELS8681345.1 eae-like domain protein [Escherichia coli]